MLRDQKNPLCQTGINQIPISFEFMSKVHPKTHEFLGGFSITILTTWSLPNSL